MLQRCLIGWFTRSSRKIALGAKTAKIEKLPRLRVLAKCLETWAFSFVRGEFLRKTFGDLADSFNLWALRQSFQILRKATTADRHRETALTNKAFLVWEREVLLTQTIKSAGSLAVMHAKKVRASNSFKSWRDFVNLKIRVSARPRLHLLFEHWHRAWRRKTQLRGFLGESDAVIY